MNKEQKQLAMELLISHEKSKIVSDISRLEIDSHENFSVTTIQLQLSSINLAAENLCNLEQEYEYDFPKKEFTADDIPF